MENRANIPDIDAQHADYSHVDRGELKVGIGDASERIKQEASIHADKELGEWKALYQEKFDHHFAPYANRNEKAPMRLFHTAWASFKANRETGWYKFHAEGFNALATRARLVEAHINFKEEHKNGFAGSEESRQAIRNAKGKRKDWLAQRRTDEGKEEWLAESDAAANEIIDRKAAGEQTEQDLTLQADLQQLMERYVEVDNNGNYVMSDQAFDSDRRDFLDQVKQFHPELYKDTILLADNITGIAKEVRSRHSANPNSPIERIELVLGQQVSRGELDTRHKRDLALGIYDRARKAAKGKGRFLFNTTTMGLAAGVAFYYGPRLIGKGALWGGAATGVGVLAGVAGATAAGYLAGRAEGRDKLVQVGREAAIQKVNHANTTNELGEDRQEVLAGVVEKRPIEEVIGSITELTDRLDAQAAPLSAADKESLLAVLAETEARLKVGGERRQDLFSYDGTRKIGRSRMRLQVEMARAQRILQPHVLQSEVDQRVKGQIEGFTSTVKGREKEGRKYYRKLAREQAMRTGKKALFFGALTIAGQEFDIDAQRAARATIDAASPVIDRASEHVSDINLPGMNVDSFSMERMGFMQSALAQDNLEDGDIREMPGATQEGAEQAPLPGDGSGEGQQPVAPTPEQTPNAHWPGPSAEQPDSEAESSPTPDPSAEQYPNAHDPGNPVEQSNSEANDGGTPHPSVEQYPNAHGPDESVLTIDEGSEASGGDENYQVSPPNEQDPGVSEPYLGEKPEADQPTDSSKPAASEGERETEVPFIDDSESAPTEEVSVWHEIESSRVELDTSKFDYVTYNEDFVGEYNELEMKYIENDEGKIVIDASGMIRGEDFDGDGNPDIDHDDDLKAVIFLTEEDRLNGEGIVLDIDDETGQVVLDGENAQYAHLFENNDGEITQNVYQVAIASDEGDGAYTFYASYTDEDITPDEIKVLDSTVEEEAEVAPDSEGKQLPDPEDRTNNSQTTPAVNTGEGESGSTEDGGAETGSQSDITVNEGEGGSEQESDKPIPGPGDRAGDSQVNPSVNEGESGSGSQTGSQAEIITNEGEGGGEQESDKPIPGPEDRTGDAQDGDSQGEQENPDINVGEGGAETGSQADISVNEGEGGGEPGEGDQVPESDSGGEGSQEAPAVNEGGDESGTQTNVNTNEGEGGNTQTEGEQTPESDAGDEGSQDTPAINEGGDEAGSQTDVAANEGEDGGSGSPEDDGGEDGSQTEVETNEGEGGSAPEQVGNDTGEQAEIITNEGEGGEGDDGSPEEDVNETGSQTDVETNDGEAGEGGSEEDSDQDGQQGNDRSRQEDMDVNTGESGDGATSEGQGGEPAGQDDPTTNAGEGGGSSEEGGQTTVDTNDDEVGGGDDRAEEDDSEAGFFDREIGNGNMPIFPAGFARRTQLRVPEILPPQRPFRPLVAQEATFIDRVVTEDALVEAEVLALWPPLAGTPQLAAMISLWPVLTQVGRRDRLYEALEAHNIQGPAVGPPAPNPAPNAQPNPNPNQNPQAQQGQPQQGQPQQGQPQQGQPQPGQQQQGQPQPPAQANANPQPANPPAGGGANPAGGQAGNQAGGNEAGGAGGGAEDGEGADGEARAETEALRQQVEAMRAFLQNLQDEIRDSFDQRFEDVRNDNNQRGQQLRAYFEDQISRLQDDNDERIRNLRGFIANELAQSNQEVVNLLNELRNRPEAVDVTPRLDEIDQRLQRFEGQFDATVNQLQGFGGLLSRMNDQFSEFEQAFGEANLENREGLAAMAARLDASDQNRVQMAELMRQNIDQLRSELSTAREELEQLATNNNQQVVQAITELNDRLLQRMDTDSDRLEQLAQIVERLAEQTPEQIVIPRQVPANRLSVAERARQRRQDGAGREQRERPGGIERPTPTTGGGPEYGEFIRSIAEEKLPLKTGAAEFWYEENSEGVWKNSRRDGEPKELEDVKVTLSNLMNRETGKIKDLAKRKQARARVAELIDAYIDDWESGRSTPTERYNWLVMLRNGLFTNDIADIT